MDEIKKDYGKPLKPIEVSQLFKIDVKTLKKHYVSFGGIEIYPGRYRFFSNIIAEKIKRVKHPDYKILKGEQANASKSKSDRTSKPKRYISDKHKLFNR